MTHCIRAATSIVLVAGLTAAACTEPSEPTELELKQELSPLPGPRGYTALVYDAESSEYVALGGVGSPGRPVWAADRKGETWRLMGTLPTGNAVTAAYHAGLDRIVVWFPTRPRPDGGGNLEPFLRADAVSETWTYDLDENRWERIVTAVSPPPGLQGTRMAYDAQSRKVILFGGYDFLTNSVHDETWAFDLDSGTWANRQPAVHPGGRSFHGQPYHAAADRVLVIGGADVSLVPLDDVWAYDHEANTWTRLAAPGAPARDYVTVAYVDETERVVLHGGMLYGPGFEELTQSDTWEYDLAADRWELIDTGGPVQPGPRAFHAMAARAGSEQVLMFGGGASFDALTEEVWQYRAGDHDWKRMR